MIGIFIGIAAIVSLVGLGEGLRSAINSQFNFLSSDLIRVMPSGGLGPPGSSPVDPLSTKNVEQIRRLPGVKLAAGRVTPAASIEFNKKKIFSLALSFPDGKERKFIEKQFNYKAREGRLLKDGDRFKVVVGNKVAKESTFGKSIRPGNKIRIEGTDFEVVGTLKSQGSFVFDYTVAANERDIREVFGLDNEEYDIIGVQVDKSADIKRVRDSIERLLRKKRGVKEGEEDFSVETAESIIDSVNSTILAVQIFIYIIAGISIVVGGIGIMNTMYTAVAERKKEIGILKSIGARNSSIFALFFLESGLLGSVGGIIGIIIGITISKIMALVGSMALGSDLISAEISPYLILGSLLFSFLLGTIFGSLPAYQASRLNPVDAIRGGK